MSFRGSWDGGRRVDGFGVLVWPDGAIYQGQWVDEKRDGLGLFTYPDQSLFTGQWSRDHRVDGPGKMRYYNGDMYDGQFMDDKRHGEGTIEYGQDDRDGRWRAGDRFVGRWAYDSRAGVTIACIW